MEIRPSQLAAKPEPDRKLRRRVHKALERLWTEEDVSGVKELPGMDPRYVFDFKEGWRLCITRERREDGKEYVHYSLGAQFGRTVPLPQPVTIDAMIQILIGLATRIQSPLGEIVETQITERAFHAWIRGSHKLCTTR